MNRIILVLAIALCGIAAQAQKKVQGIFGNELANAFKYQNSVSLELGGHGLVYSINYERQIINTTRYKLGLQAGIGYYPPFVDLRSGVWLPFSINNIFSVAKSHHLEAGLGIVPTQFQYYQEPSGRTYYECYWETFPTGKIGYRFQKPNSRFVFKALFTPFIVKERYQTYRDAEIIASAALAFGYNF